MEVYIDCSRTRGKPIGGDLVGAEVSFCSGHLSITRSVSASPVPREIKMSTSTNKYRWRASAHLAADPPKSKELPRKSARPTEGNMSETRRGMKFQGGAEETIRNFKYLIYPKAPLIPAVSYI